MRIIVVVEYFKIMNSCVNFIISIINYIVTNIRIFIGVSFVTYIITFHQNKYKMHRRYSSNHVCSHFGMILNKVYWFSYFKFTLAPYTIKMRQVCIPNVPTLDNRMQNKRDTPCSRTLLNVVRTVSGLPF